MALPKFNSVDQTKQNRRTRPRLTRENDGPVASPVHALQQRVEETVLTIENPLGGQISPMRIFLYLIVPATLWAGIIKAAVTLF